MQQPVSGGRSGPHRPQQAPAGPTGSSRPQQAHLGGQEELAGAVVGLAPLVGVLGALVEAQPHLVPAGTARRGAARATQQRRQRRCMPLGAASGPCVTQQRRRRHQRQQQCRGSGQGPPTPPRRPGPCRARSPRCAPLPAPLRHTGLAATPSAGAGAGGPARPARSCGSGRRGVQGTPGKSMGRQSCMHSASMCVTWRLGARSVRDQIRRARGPARGRRAGRTCGTASRHPAPPSAAA